MIKRPINAGYIYPYPVSSANTTDITEILLKVALLMYHSPNPI